MAPPEDEATTSEGLPSASMSSDVLGTSFVVSPPRQQVRARLFSPLFPLFGVGAGWELECITE